MTEEPTAQPELKPVRTKPVLPPGIQADRMQRYSIYLIVCAFLLVMANYKALTIASVLWFAAGLSAGFGIVCAVTVVMLNGLAWNFDRLAEELRGGRHSQSIN